MSTELTPEQEKQMQERANDEAHRAIAWVVNLMKKRFGEEAYQVLVEEASEGARQRFSKLAEEAIDNSIEAFLKYGFEPLLKDGFEYTVEETNAGYQMNYTKCPVADMAKRLGITELMFYMCCEQDHVMPGAFNPDIGFKRTKTLMQGDSCCDHFYYYKEPQSK